MQLYNVFAFPVVRDQLIANAILVAVATFLVILRGVSRRIRKSHLGWDDPWCVAGLFHTYGMLAMQYHYARVGMRHHITTILPENVNAMVLAKFSYLACYLRVFVSREWRILTWICMGCAGAYWPRSMLQTFLICTPFEKSWNPTLRGHYVSQNVAFSTIGAFNLLLDVTIMALPIRFVRKLQMSTATKLALVGIFGLVFPRSPSSASVFTTVDFTDLSYSMIWAAFWSVTEPTLAIANSCAPMLRPIHKAAFLSLFSSVRTAYSTQPSTKPALSRIER
ncbi:unnamed protein product [Penicillium nalgiovense]|uniref:Rhodopsin domain-containing protein n=1 Tax=Penicillium nalgiovense TaxID=60175 RepID=A0A9W4HUC6_PENNA|nr:unnamed protein product [Penicillium nalgiovense]CAG7946150.1 unnamed protein product [Penicillium nalgiovense]CAG7955284.1 unnamed protein product [Penicillium nalgiovense]CAG7975066.1 unnamed protein product [Penicillium nalgiovense]CAG8053815.1 unnamed protein product [Penicillium nalgiovense]